ncbi:hypothetical protein BBK14_27520 [Parafrankia soli]|uniref:Uncharacterized protein n=1 Tax=Parafrankia soli TaxID=2599596 RepID=A0A1S1PGR4_9ACTN|nr:hypothetical protein [Parafrankia soli]OHV20900.1 hypothetical protein BBK14_27520 [Parafrankia soli]
MLRLTTDAELAADADNIELLGATHPLVLVAAQHVGLSGVSTASFRVRSDLVPPGRYPIAIYGWTRFDTRDTLTLRYISTDQDVEAVADSLLAMALDGDHEATIESKDVELLEQRHHMEWCSARDRHVSRAHTAAAQRVASLHAQRDRQLRTLEENASKVIDAKIMKMRQSQMASAREKYDRLIAQHQKAVGGAELVTRHLATAMLEVVAP